MTSDRISNGFLAAGLSNILGVIICSKGFTNQTMMNVQPEVMGAFGLLAIILWGAAYIAVSRSYDRVRWLVAVFVVEKLAYVISWLTLLTTRGVGDIYAVDMLAGIFYTVYGVNDLIFMLFFAYVFVTTGRPQG